MADGLDGKWRPELGCTCRQGVGIVTACCTGHSAPNEVPSRPTSDGQRMLAGLDTAERAGTGRKKARLAHCRCKNPRSASSSSTTETCSCASSCSRHPFDGRPTSQRGARQAVALWLRGDRGGQAGRRARDRGLGWPASQGGQRRGQERRRDKAREAWEAGKAGVGSGLHEGDRASALNRQVGGCFRFTGQRVGRVAAVGFMGPGVCQGCSDCSLSEVLSSRPDSSSACLLLSSVCWSAFPGVELLRAMYDVLRSISASNIGSHAAAGLLCPGANGGGSQARRSRALSLFVSLVVHIPRSHPRPPCLAVLAAPASSVVPESQWAPRDRPEQRWHRHAVHMDGSSLSSPRVARPWPCDGSARA